jgi:hypothetical protein
MPWQSFPPLKRDHILKHAMETNNKQERRSKCVQLAIPACHKFLLAATSLRSEISYNRYELAVKP